MELLLGYLGYELLGTVILVVTVYLSARKKKPKPVQVSKAEQIAAETARLETENKRLEREYETLRDERFEALHVSGCSCNECLGKRYLSLPEEVRKPPLKSHNVPADLPERVKAKADQFEADCRAVRIKAEFAYYQNHGNLPPDSLLDSRMLAELTSYYELSVAKAFNTVPMILTDGTRIEFRKLS